MSFFQKKKAPAASRRAHLKSFKQHQQHKNKTRTRKIRTRRIIRIRIRIRIYSSPTRRHLPYPYILLQQEDTIYSSPTRRHLFLSNKKTSILLQQDDICSSPTTRHILLPQEDISCVHTAYTMSLEHTYRVHKDQTWSKSKNMKILTFSRD